MSPELIAISERIRDHLTKQKAQSMGTYGEDNNGGCMYRGPEGLMCAVGCLIKDEEYNYLMEGSPAASFDVMKAVSDSLGVEMSPELEWVCSHWQAYHDGASTGVADFLYSKWVDGNEHHHPGAFHDHLLRII